MATPILFLGAWDFWAHSSGNLHAHKIPRFSFFFVFFCWGGGSANLFLWAQGFF